MAKNRKKYRRGRRKKGNWFTQMKMWQRVLVCVGGVLICLIGAAGIYVAAKWDKVDTRDIKAEDIVINPEIRDREVDLGDGYTNIALFGVDSREGDLGEGNRTDCIIVASLNNETKEIKMVSVYRDTLLDLSEGTYQKCNAAYSYGGPTMAINMLNMNLDLDIQDYVTVDFGAISDVVDLVGGIEMDVTDEEAYYISEYLQETADAAGKAAHFLDYGGHMVLDGPQATTYARIRSTAGGDFTRTERQRLVIEKIVEKLQKVDVMTLNKIIDQVFPQVSTSFTLQELMNYALAYKDYVLLENAGFPFEKTTDTLPEIGSVVIPTDLTSNVTKLHEFLFGATGYAPSSTVNTLSANISYTANSGGTTDTSGWEQSQYTDNSTFNESYVDPNAGNNTWQEPSTDVPSGGETNQGTTDPGVTDPGVTDPGVTDPGTGGTDQNGAAGGETQ